MRKFVYDGDAAFARGPYRGETPESVADAMAETIAKAAKAGKMKPEEEREIFLSNLKDW